MTAQEKLYKLKELDKKILGVILGNIDASILESYSYSDADGSQSTRRRNPQDLWKWHLEIENEITELERSFQGGGIRTFGTRTRP